jgi:Arc/MetJ-type ribon-helix-helix transcriptional regulator
VPFVQAVISTGRCRSETEVVAEALRVFQELEEQRKKPGAEIRVGVNSGESIPGDEVFNRLGRNLPTWFDCRSGPTLRHWL